MFFCEEESVVLESLSVVFKNLFLFGFIDYYATEVFGAVMNCLEDRLLLSIFILRIRTYSNGLFARRCRWFCRLRHAVENRGFLFAL